MTQLTDPPPVLAVLPWSHGRRVRAAVGLDAAMTGCDFFTALAPSPPFFLELILVLFLISIFPSPNIYIFIWCFPSFAVFLAFPYE